MTQQMQKTKKNYNREIDTALERSVGKPLGVCVCGGGGGGEGGERERGVDEGWGEDRVCVWGRGTTPRKNQMLPNRDRRCKKYQHGIHCINMVKGSIFTNCHNTIIAQIVDNPYVSPVR